MTWTKTGDEFADECWTLSDAAYRLHHEGLTWSNRKGLDGRLDKDDMVRWAKRPAAAEELVSIGWWEDHGSHYQIIHHIGYQRTREEIAHQSNVNRANINKRWSKNTNRKTNRKTNRNTKWPGQDRPGQENRGTSLSDGEKTDNPDADYAADYRAWCDEDEP
jgi:hypothetical protein